MIDYEARKSIIGERISKERKRKKMSKKDLLAKIYLAESSHKTLASWEKGERIPDLDSLARMADIFQCDIGYLLGDYDEHTRLAADIVRETSLSEKAVQNVLYMKQHDFNALFSLSSFLETYIPKQIPLSQTDAPDRESAAGIVLGYIGTPKPTGTLALAPDGTAVINTQSGANLLPPGYAAVYVSLADASRMVLHDKLIEKLDALREENGGTNYRQTMNQELEYERAKSAYEDARKQLMQNYPELRQPVDKLQEYLRGERNG